MVFSARTIVVPFPECDKFFRLAGETVELPPALAEVLRATLVYAPGEYDEGRRAELHLKKDEVVCVAENNGERIEHTVPAPGMRPPPNIPKLHINPVFFRAILQRVTKMKVGKGGTRVLFRAGNFSHVMDLPRE